MGLFFFSTHDDNDDENYTHDTFFTQNLQQKNLHESKFLKLNKK